MLESIIFLQNNPSFTNLRQHYEHLNFLADAKYKEKLYDEAIMYREQMLELLTKYTPLSEDENDRFNT